LLQEPRLELWSAEFLANAGALEPNLLLVLAALCAAPGSRASHIRPAPAWSQW
jgi:hypothetical protein